MSTARAVELSLFPDHAPDKPVGPILPSVFVGTNSDLMAAVAPYYLTGSVLDVTYGEGKWWERFTPHPFVAHDLKTDGVDFTNLPEASETFDAVCFDPPYIPQGGTKDDRPAVGKRFKDAFGLVTRTERELWDLIGDGLAECSRVVKRRGAVLVKCTDYGSGASLVLGHLKVVDAAERNGLRCHDLIVHHTGSGPGGHNIFTPTRARRHHSYLLVFTKGARR